MAVSRFLVEHWGSILVAVASLVAGILIGPWLSSRRTSLESLNLRLTAAASVAQVVLVFITAATIVPLFQDAALEQKIATKEQQLADQGRELKRLTDEVTKFGQQRAALVEEVDALRKERSDLSAVIDEARLSTAHAAEISRKTRVGVSFEKAAHVCIYPSNRRFTTAGELTTCLLDLVPTLRDVSVADGAELREAIAVKAKDHASEYNRLAALVGTAASRAADRAMGVPDRWAESFAEATHIAVAIVNEAAASLSPNACQLAGPPEACATIAGPLAESKR